MVWDLKGSLRGSSGFFVLRINFKILRDFSKDSVGSGGIFGKIGWSFEGFQSNSMDPAGFQRILSRMFRI